MTVLGFHQKPRLTKSSPKELLTVHNPYRNPERYHLVQFYFDEQNFIKPLWTKPFDSVESPKYPGQKFLSPPGSKYGIRKIKNATHWAIVYEYDNSVEVLHYGPFNALNNLKRVIPFAETDLYVLLKASTHYLMVYISNQTRPLRQPVSQKATT